MKASNRRTAKNIKRGIQQEGKNVVARGGKKKKSRWKHKTYGYHANPLEYRTKGTKKKEPCRVQKGGGKKICAGRNSKKKKQGMVQKKGISETWGSKGKQLKHNAQVRKQSPGDGGYWKKKIDRTATPLVKQNEKKMGSNAKKHGCMETSESRIFYQKKKRQIAPERLLIGNHNERPRGRRDRGKKLNLLGKGRFKNGKWERKPILSPLRKKT